jgi:WXXGXW repeat (2 copies)
VGLASLTAARADAGTRVYVRIGPPAPIVEVRPAAVRGQVWVGGYHHWNGHAYVWTPGRWAAPPRGRSVWVAPRWVHDRRHGWYFVAGHWR